MQRITNHGEPRATKTSEDCFSHVISAGLSSVEEAIAVNSDLQLDTGGSVTVNSFTAIRVLEKFQRGEIFVILFELYALTMAF